MAENSFKREVEHLKQGEGQHLHRRGDPGAD